MPGLQLRSSVEEALAASQRRSVSTIDRDQLLAYIKAKSLRDLQHRQPEDPARAMPLPNPRMEDVHPWTDPARKLIASMGRSASSLAQPSNEIGRLIRSKEGAEAISGMAAGTGMIRPAKLGFDFIPPARNTQLFSSNIRLNPEMDIVSGSLDLKNSVAYLNTIQTSKMYRYQGAGEESLLGLAQNLREKSIKELRLESLGDAFEFYRKLGFKATEAPEWPGAVIPMRVKVDNLLKTLEKRGVESRFPADREPGTASSLAAREAAAKANLPMIVGRKGPAHVEFHTFDPGSGMNYYKLQKPITNVFDEVVHPEGTILSGRSLRDYGLGIPVSKGTQRLSKEYR